jgi:hypothetical protein
VAIQQLFHPAGPHHRSDQTIAQSPVPRTQIGGRLQDDRVPQRQGIIAAGLGRRLAMLRYAASDGKG